MHCYQYIQNPVHEEFGIGCWSILGLLVNACVGPSQQWLQYNVSFPKYVGKMGPIAKGLIKTHSALSLTHGMDVVSILVY